MTARGAARLLGLVLALHAAAGPVAAQQDGLIVLPEGDSAPGAPEQAEALAQDRIAAGRGGGAPRDRDTAPAEWVAPLRLLDLQIARDGAMARVTGERQVVAFDLHVSDPARTHRLQLRTVSSINLLPERSRMTVTINGTELGQAPLDNFEDPALDAFKLPPGTLAAGRNRVQITFRQSHRIFCGPEASFELWTDLDMTRSGLVVAAGSLDGPSAFMMGLAAQAARAAPVEIRGTDSLGAAAEAWRGALVQRLNRALGGAPVVFSFTDYWTVARRPPARARVTLVPAAQSRASFRTGGDGAQVMVLEVAQGTRPRDLLDRIAQLAPPERAARAPVLATDATTRFADFGIETESFSQRYAIRHHPFRLPEDWLILTAEKARIDLDYIYADGLPDDAMLLLRVNGQSIRLLPLRDRGGVPITDFPIDFEARIMQPGTNTLTFEVMIPGDPPDLPCPAHDRPFLRIGGDSSLTVPYSPPMAIPDMDLAFGALTPDSLQVNAMSARAYSDTDVLTLQAALARTRGAAGAATLHLISIDDLGAVPMADHRVERRVLEDTVLMSPDVEALMAEQQAANDPFARRRAQSGGGIGAALGRARALVIDRLEWVRDRIFPSNGDQLNDWLAARRAQAVLLQLDPDRPDAIWMLRSPDSDIHAIAHAIAGARAYGRGPRGQVALLGHDGRWDNWLAPDRQPRLLEPWSLRNFRVAMGNLVSARPIFYTLLVLLLALTSALVALRLVISTREKP